MNHSTLTAPAPTRLSDRLLGRKVLVTGSSKGIGRGIAIRLAQEGADVVINYNSDPKAPRRLLRRSRPWDAAAPSFTPISGRSRDVRDLVARSADALGGLDVLVNNAGIEKHAAFWDVTERDFDAVLNVNLKGVFFATQAFVQQCLAAAAAGQDHQHQLGPRGARVPELRRVLRQQGRRADADQHARRRARARSASRSTASRLAPSRRRSTASC